MNSDPNPPAAARIVPAARRQGRAARAKRKLTTWWSRRRYHRYTANPIEIEARLIAGMPVGHPEILTRRRHELDGLAQRLWPGGEYPDAP